LKISEFKILAILAGIVVLIAAGPVRADNITGGAVTGGSAFTAGGIFDHLTVP
jgi:hypothetical protein